MKPFVLHFKSQQDSVLNHNKTDFQDSVMIYRHAERERKRERVRERERERERERRN